MARLIDADALIERLEKHSSYDLGYFDEELDEIIKTQPTAYDVEKVVGELERMRIDESQGCHSVSTVKCNEYKNCADCIFDRAIDIIRQDGVE